MLMRSCLSALAFAAGKPRHGSEPVADAEDDVRTPGSAEFFLREPPESPDHSDAASAHTAFTYEQQLQWRAQAFVSGDLRVGKPIAEHTMVRALGEPVEGVWQEVWRAAVDRWESQKSLVPGYDTTPSSSLIGSCTPESKDTTVCKIIHHHDGGEEASQGLNVESAWGSPENTTEHTEVLMHQTGEEAVIISEQKQYAGVEEARQGVDIGSDRSHPLVNITEHYCNLALHDRGSETRSFSKKKPDPCVKCGKEGQLLKCRTCSLAAHGSCFGSSVRYNDSGMFDCPVCLFNKADEAYEKAKIARSEARKSLSAFFSSDQSVKQHNENQSIKQRNRQSKAATTFGPDPADGKVHEVENSISSQDRFSPTIADSSILADKENGLNSPMTRSRRVRFHIKETVVSRSYGKASGRRDHQFMHSPARKRCYAQSPEFHSSPATPPARSPPGPTRRHVTSTARRKMTRWTRAEETALREGVAKYLAEHPGAAAGNRNISWVRILEDGADSFNPVRKSCDLGKKWGRMKLQGWVLRENGGLGCCSPPACMEGNGKEGEK